MAHAVTHTSMLVAVHSAALQDVVQFAILICGADTLTIIPTITADTTIAHHATLIHTATIDAER